MTKKMAFTVTNPAPKYNIGPGTPPGSPVEAPRFKQLVVTHFDYDEEPVGGIVFFRRFGLKRGVHLKLGLEEGVISKEDAKALGRALLEGRP